MNPISFNPNFARILLLSTALVVSINIIAGGRSNEHNLMDDYLHNTTSINPDASALLRSCVLELCVVALPLLRIFVSVLTSENFLSKSSLFTPVAPRLKTKALLLMSVDRLIIAGKTLIKLIYNRYN
jgi:hypothetical protein